MSDKWIHTIMDNVDRASGLDPTAKLILLVLAEYAVETGETAPSVTTVANLTGISERRTRTHLAHLQAAGWIVAEPNVGGRWQTTRRWLNVPK